MDSNEVIGLLEVLQSDVQGFDEMLFQAVADIEAAEQPNTENTQAEEPEQMPISPPESNPVSETSTVDATVSKEAGRFKQLEDADLLEIERNQYSEATKRNTKWGFKFSWYMFFSHSVSYQTNIKKYPTFSPLPTQFFHSPKKLILIF